MKQLKAKIEDVQSTYSVINELKNLETQNLLKNAFLIDLADIVRGSYDSGLKDITMAGKNRLLNAIESKIDGLIQSSGDLLDVNFTVSLVSEVIEEIGK